MHKKCNKINPEINIVQQDSQALCNFCIDKTNNPCTLWNLLPFPEESLNEIDNEVLDHEIDINNLSHTVNWNDFKKRGLHLLHLNINSLLPKIDELRYIAKNSNATVIGVSESKLDNSVLNEEVNIEGYKILRSDRNRHGGGVACYIKNDITFTERENFSTDLENIFFDILLPKSKPILVGIIYRPPDQQMFLAKLTSAFFNTSKFDSQEVYILGDININLLTKENHVPNGIRRYREFCSTHGLKQIITSPTRVTENSSTLLDHILTNSIEKVSQYGVIDLSISDHQLIYCTRKTTHIKYPQHKYIKVRSLKNYTVEHFCKLLKNIHFPRYSMEYNDINEAYTDIIEKVMSVINQIAPLKEIRIKGNTQQWFDEEIMEEIRIRDKMFSKFKKSKLHIDNVNYKKARNHVQSLIKRKKKNFITTTLKNNIGKPRELWKSLKKLGLPSKSDPQSDICLMKDGKLSFDHKTNAETFKDFFSNLASNLVAKLPMPSNKFGMETVKNYYKDKNLEQNNFVFKPTNIKVILKLLEDINSTKAAGIDNLAGKFLKDGASILAVPISDLCDLSIATSIFPERCKIAKLKPLYKKGPKTEPKNYRPISLLPLISKIIEKVIHNQTQEYLDKYEVLYRYQSGFRVNHSTNTSLSYLNDKILKGLDKGSLTGMILIDLQKAFDTIDHEILLKKMIYIGFSKSVIHWFKSYLQNRTFVVNVGKEYSTCGEVNCGVPQGSILGPLLFLLYINDMSQAVECELLLYADDSCLIFTDNNIETIENKLNKDFNSLCEWFVENKLSIHFGEDKTKSILFGSKHKLKNIKELDIKYGEIKIKQNSKVTYLGCILDNNLSGESMATKVMKTVNNRLKFLYRKQTFLNSTLRRLLCNALIQPHFDYASTAWYPNLNKRLTKGIQIAQNKCIRFCLGLENRTHIGVDEFVSINWLPTKQRFEQCVCVSVFKFFKETTPNYVSEIYHPINQSHDTRRSKNKLHLPLCTKNSGQKALSYMGPKLWNNLSSNVKSVSDINLNKFKHDLKEIFFEDLKKKENDIYIYY